MTGALVEAAKALETTMRTIFDRKGWSYPNNPNASLLVDAVIDNGLIPPTAVTELGWVKGILSSTAATVRNKLAAHSSGSQPDHGP